MSLTEKEKKFADEYVYGFFHTNAVTTALYARSAVVAGYAKEANRNAENIAMELLGKRNVKEYVDSEIERFRSILADAQGKALWKHISKFEPGESDEECFYSGRIILH